jgi:uncharacterized protein YjbI with pentapeptide repeats
MSCPAFSFAKVFLCNSSLLSLLALPFCGAAEIPLEVQKSTVVTFPSESGKTYKLLSATDPSPASWALAQDGIQGTGGKVTVFYKSEGDQKLFFKVEEGPATNPDQKPLYALARLDLSRRDLTGYQLAGQVLNGFNLDSSIFDRANLKGADLTGANLPLVSAQGADLSNARVAGVNASRANFSGANLSGVKFSNANLNRANLSGANLTGTSFEVCNLTFVNLAGQNLANRSFRGSSFDGANLRGADFSGADLRETVFYQTSQVFSEGIRLDGANCEGAYLAGLNLTGSDLRRTFLRGAEVGGSGLADVNLSGNDLTLLIASTQVGGLFLIKPLLTHANLRNANLYGASLRWADLRGADLTGADLSYADLAGADLTGATGFDTNQPGIYFGDGAPAGGGGGGGGGYGGYSYGGGGGSAGPFAYATLPDGSQKSGPNPGSNFAPATVPPRIHLTINETGVKTESNLTYSGNHYYDGAVDIGQVAGWSTARGIIAVLGFTPVEHYVSEYYATVTTLTYTFLFDTPTSGRLFRNLGTPKTLIGTFDINP